MKLTPEEVLATAKINPELEQILKETPWVDILKEDSDIPKIRQSIARYRLETRSTLPPYDNVEEDIQIPVRDGTTITVRIHKPKTIPEDGCPIFVVYHGGGFCLGGLDDQALLCREFTKLGGIAVNVDYRLAPEYPFPTGLLDAHDALKWTAANFERLGGNPAKDFLIGGISAGAQFSATLALLARDEKLSPPLTGTYLSILPIGPAELIPEKYKDVFLAREQNKDAPILNTTAMIVFNKHYKPDPESPLRSPLAFESHKDLPPTYFQIAGMDALRDDALVYERILSEDNGVLTKIDMYAGLPHGFWGRWPEAEFSKQLQRDSVKALEWLLEQSK